MTTIDWNFIRKLEGFSKEGYVPYEGHSGVTVGAGFDIGQKGKAELYSMGFSLPLLTKLLPYVGLKDQAAEDLLFTKPLRLNDAEAAELDEKVRKIYAKQIEDEYNAYSDFTFCMLDSPKQTVITSVGFQYGSLKKKCPAFFDAITKGLWKVAVRELRNFGDAYDRRHEQEADLLESSIKTILTKKETNEEPHYNR